MGISPAGEKEEYVAATKESVLERPKHDYERYREWLLNTTLDDSISGRILEYSRHSESGPLVDPIGVTR